MSYERN